MLVEHFIFKSGWSLKCSSYFTIHTFLTHFTYHYPFLHIFWHPWETPWSLTWGWVFLFLPQTQQDLQSALGDILNLQVQLWWGGRRSAHPGFVLMTAAPSERIQLQNTFLGYLHWISISFCKESLPMTVAMVVSVSCDSDLEDCCEVSVATLLHTRAHTSVIRYMLVVDRITVQHT